MKKLFVLLPGTKAQLCMKSLNTVGAEYEAQTAELEQQLEDARARIPKHTPPAALMAEIDELEEELERLQSLPEA